MLRMFAKILKVGVVTESPPSLRDSDTAAFEADGKALRAIVDRRFRGSVAIRQVDAGSCNGCELEIQALNNPYHSIERFGVHFVASPRHADILLVTGPVSRHMEAALRRTWAATPQPRWVIAAGDCASCGGEFGVSYASCGAVDKVVPVDLQIPGCPPTPGQLLAGILALLQKRA
ncbi:MAG TPA: NADH-quinone oxidoreductase subunit NuoB [Gammaproteobacteria bacterium]|nr:NADH-quinone oxidoreductase subunit NuoB [Gammaproteobacteria bacterium]HRP86557.1 NADH-quinone oxidoreductase subunit NuoB [Gammaproteobacteria bacterium]